MQAIDYKSNIQHLWNSTNLGDKVASPWGRYPLIEDNMVVVLNITTGLEPTVIFQKTSKW